ncbi:hypothetical protein IW262DRAFT_520555 [Armillaria fumosa]|nr:hypothetical protein IW262DRAFT_520555 [Armillaria fumosa]
MLFVIAACIIPTVLVAWLSPSVSERLTTTTGISWRWLDAPLVDVGLPEPNMTSTEMGDTFFQAVVILAEPSALQAIDVVTVLKADSSQNEPDDMDTHADDTPPQGIIWQLLEPAVAVVEVPPSATTPVDDAVTLVSVHPQPTQFPASVARVGSRLWSSSLSSSIAPVSLFAIAIVALVSFAVGFFARSVFLFTGWDKLPTLFVEVCDPSETITSFAIDSVVSSAEEAYSGGQISEVVVEDIPVPEKTEHDENLKATDNTASIPSGNVSSSDAVQPLRTSVSVQFTSDVCEVKDASVGMEPVSKTSVGTQFSMTMNKQTDVSVGTEPISKTSVGIQPSMAADEQTDKFTPSGSRASLYATAAEGNSPSQTTDGPDVFSVPPVSSSNNIYMLAATMSFPSVDKLANVTEFERLRQDVREFGDESKAEGSTTPTLPATELGVSPSTTPSAPVMPRPVPPKPLEYFRDCWGSDTKVSAARSGSICTHAYHSIYSISGLVSSGIVR